MKNECRAEIERRGTTLFCLKKRGHKGWHLNPGPWWDEPGEMSIFAKAGKFNKDGDFMWPQKRGGVTE
jgi:hypothetical protein